MENLQAIYEPFNPSAMNTNTPTEIKNHLEDMVNGMYAYGNELVFDPMTGELIIRNKHDKTTCPDGQALEQLAEDGFM
jgi:hypothetical protein